MYNTNVPSKMDVPSTAQLLKSTAIAAAVAGVLLVTVVMPAEYGIDPTGAGEVLQLTEQGRIKMSLAKEAEAEALAAETATKATPVTAAPVVQVQTTPMAETTAPVANRTDEMKITLAPDQGTEVKVTMRKGDKVNYVWFTDTGVVNYDVHGDSKELNINYHGYGKGKATPRQEGVIEAAFDGHHGWFWRNRTSGNVVITLQTNGAYTDIKQAK